MPVGSEQRLMMGAAGSAGGNYFGDGSDGALSTSGDVTYTVLNKSGSYDGDMLVKNFTSMTIATGDTVTLDQGCRGFLCYVDGDVSITGTLSMKGKGGHCDPTASGGSDSSAVNTDGLQLGMFTASGTDTLAAATFEGSGDAAVAAVANQPAIAGDGTKFSMIKLGAGGGSGGSTNCANCGVGGSGGTAGTTSAVAISTGGGGGGGAWGGSGAPSIGGAGGQGGVFSGGAGGGGKCFSGSASGGGNYGGAGGAGGSNNQNQGGAHGGAGNPGGGGAGNGPSYGGTGGRPGDTGCGGILWLIVSGDVTVNSGGLITASGSDSGKGSAHRTPGGGSSGGGSLMILQAGTYTNNGTVEAPGGTVNTYGGIAGAGGIYQALISE